MTETLGNKTEIILKNMDNMKFETSRKFDFIYADMIYEDLNLSWLNKYWEFLKDGGIFVVQTDWHSIFEVGYHMKYKLKDSFHLNNIVWKNEFGNFPKNKFRQAHDDIVIFSKGKNYKFYPEKVQMEKATAKSKGLNPSGRTTKLATSVWSDITLTTIAKERIKKEDGHNIKWQKPIELMERLVIPFTDEGDWVLDNFMGSGTLAEWCKRNKRNYVGIEYDKEPYSLAKSRLENIHGRI